MRSVHHAHRAQLDYEYPSELSPDADDYVQKNGFLPGQTARGNTSVMQSAMSTEMQHHGPHEALVPAYVGAAKPQRSVYAEEEMAIVTQPRGGAAAGRGGRRGRRNKQQGDWMRATASGLPNCPPGLEYLTTIDQLLVRQKVELLEAFVGFETNNKFLIKNALGQKVYYAVEDTDCCVRICCGPMRPFDLKIFDNHRNEVMHMFRPLACTSCCFPCCLQSMQVCAPPGHVIGSIEQEWSICAPAFRIKNHLGETVLRIEGPCCTIRCCDVNFRILTLNGEKVGKISKQWSGLMREFFTDADFFGINFPMDLDVRIKAVLLGATFLIDAMFFEEEGSRSLNCLSGLVG